MQWKDATYRIVAWFQHYLSAWNTGGEGIHSPYLFHLVRMHIYDTNYYYCWKDIEQRRACMLHSSSLISVQDFGSKGRGRCSEQMISQIAKHSLESPKVAQLFFRLISFLSSDLHRPLRIVELGTNLGITTSYFALAHSRNEIITFEGSHELLRLAKKNWQHLGITAIHPIEGNIDNTLYTYAREKIDFAFIDANHDFAPTLRYFDYLASLVHDKTIIAIDDIHYSTKMNKAWKQIQADSRVSTTMDFYHFGLVFFDPRYIRKHYILKLHHHL